MFDVLKTLKIDCLRRFCGFCALYSYRARYSVVRVRYSIIENILEKRLPKDRILEVSKFCLDFARDHRNIDFKIVSKMFVTICIISIPIRVKK